MYQCNVVESVQAGVATLSHCLLDDGVTFELNAMDERVHRIGTKTPSLIRVHYQRLIAIRA